MAAAAKFSDTFELVEIVLYQLSTRDLLFAQQISKQWKAVIDNSTRLQQALFYKAIPGGPIPFSLERKETAFKNPLLKPLFGALSEVEASSPVDLFEKIFHEEDSLHASWKCKDASWLNMFPTQPPMESFLYVQSIVDDEEDASEDIKFTRCSARKLNACQMMLGLKVLMTKTWEDGAFITLKGSGPFEAAKYLEASQQLKELIREGPETKAAPEAFEREGSEDSQEPVRVEWIDYDSDCEFGSDSDESDAESMDSEDLAIMERQRESAQAAIRFPEIYAKYTE